MKENMIVPVPSGEMGGSLVAPAIGSLVECIDALSRGAAEREAVRAKRDAVRAMLHERRDVMVSYLSHRYGERNRLYDGYFALIDRAMESGNDEVTRLALESLLQVYSAPFAAREDGIIEQCGRLSAVLGC